MLFCRQPGTCHDQGKKQSQVAHEICCHVSCPKKEGPFAIYFQLLSSEASTSKKPYFTLKYTWSTKKYFKWPKSNKTATKGLCWSESKKKKLLNCPNLSQSLANKTPHCTELAKRAVPPHEKVIVSSATCTWCFVLFLLIAGLWRVPHSTCSLWFQERRKNMRHFVPGPHWW